MVQKVVQKTANKGDDETRKMLVGYRKMIHMKQGKVAEAIGITRTSLSRYERGETALTFENTKAYARAMGLEIKFIVI
jgi:transcriptional regulator with XRE-family HTH domain